MSTATISAKVSTEQRDRLDEIATEQGIGRSELIVNTLIPMMDGSPVIVPQQSIEPHPLADKLAAKNEQIATWETEIAQLTETIAAIDYKVSAPGVELVPSGDGLLSQIADRLMLRDNEAEQRAAIAQLETTRRGAVDLVTTKRSQVAKARTEADGMALQIAADEETAAFQKLIDRYLVLAAELNAIALEYNRPLQK